MIITSPFLGLSSSEALVTLHSHNFSHKPGTILPQFSFKYFSYIQPSNVGLLYSFCSLLFLSFYYCALFLQRLRINDNSHAQLSTPDLLKTETPVSLIQLTGLYLYFDIP